jgi:hypothetical protein
MNGSVNSASIVSCLLRHVPGQEPDLTTTKLGDELIQSCVTALGHCSLRVHGCELARGFHGGLSDQGLLPFNHTTPPDMDHSRSHQTGALSPVLTSFELV